MILLKLDSPTLAVQCAAGNAGLYMSPITVHMIVHCTRVLAASSSASFLPMLSVT
jgi:hypothetical protein